MQAKEVSRRELTVRRIGVRALWKSFRSAPLDYDRGLDDNHGELTAGYAVFPGQLCHTSECTGHARHLPETAIELIVVTGMATRPGPRST